MVGTSFIIVDEDRRGVGARLLVITNSFGLEMTELHCDTRPIPKTPGEIELYSYFSQHFGARYEAAGLRVQFHYKQATPGIYFKVSVSEEYRNEILQGIQVGMASRFPEFPATGSIWITEVTEHEVNSCPRAFYRAALAVVDQAYSLASRLE
ncbi:MAG: hypothetical protein JWM99_1486 [Verrucomicrobiales bacterium]|nr:hypothetical protein [Verrucomicrobiales bacterium]